MYQINYAHALSPADVKQEDYETTMVVVFCPAELKKNYDAAKDKTTVLCQFTETKDGYVVQNCGETSYADFAEGRKGTSPKYAQGSQAFASPQASGATFQVTVQDVLDAGGPSALAYLGRAFFKARVRADQVAQPVG